ncbi:MAG: hypothetical protein ACRCUT_05935 [Spirochaetota bacterium]
MMECDCGGVLEEGKSCYRTRGDSFSLILEDVPAYRCMRCGKVLYTDETAEKIKKLVNRMNRDVKEITTGIASVNLYDY